MKRFLKAAAIIGLSAGICLAATACGSKSSGKVVPPDEAGSYSILTKLDLSVDFDGDTATARVKNTFTFFPAEARVHVYLYYSETEVNSYAEMEEVAAEYIEDLDQGETLSASWDTKGRGGYFLGRMRYKIDSREWEEKCTDKYYRDYTKVVLEKIDDDGSLPVVEDIEPIYKWNPIENERIMLKEYCEFDSLSTYIDFANEYEKKFKTVLAQDFFVFKLENSEYDFTDMPNYVEYEIYKNDAKLFFRHDILLDVEKFGYNLPLTTDPTGIGIWNLSLTLISVNIDIELSGKLIIKFTKNKGINLYIGDFCIGTCYYYSKTEKEIPYAFFYNLFAENLTNSSVYKIR